MWLKFMCVNMCSQKRIIGNQPFVAFFLSWGRGRLISRSCVIKFIEIQTVVTVTNLSETKLTTQNIRKKVWKGIGEQTWKRFKQMVFENLLDYWLTVFQRSFLLFVTFSFILMLVRHICLTWSCDLVICK